ncbi:hypothetical protein K3H53_17550 [Aeromonas veronii]|uniref:hypothetical protein n=1 Tax=Aeromonas veronii TaxID=654 RepID=UPI001F335181|nr:hypothetical protein [Aeromonas veronii]MCF5849080.1 hypothetical protein [Aeromonas veronii]
MSLRDVVAIYRACNRPPVCNSVFEGAFAISDETRIHFEALRIATSTESNNGYGRLKWATASNGDDRLDDSRELIDGEIINISYRLASSSSEKFYNDVPSILTSPIRMSLKLPDSFYILDRDIFFSSDSDTQESAEICQLQKICTLVQSLSKLAHYHDAKIIDDKNKLVFLSTEDKTPHPVVLDIELTDDIMNANLDDLSLLTSILSSDAVLDPHYQPRKSILYSSIYEFVKGMEPKAAFKKLSENWTAFAEIYQNNLGTYLSGFAFHKVRKEIAEAEIKIAEQLSKITSDLIGKLFSIPVSLAAIVAMLHKDSSLLISLLLVLGLLIAAILVVGVIINQSAQLESVKHSKNMMDQSFEGNKNNYPEKLKKDIDDMSERLNSNIETARCWLTLYRFLAWFPAVSGAIVFWVMYG